MGFLFGALTSFAVIETPKLRWRRGRWAIIAGAVGMALLGPVVAALVSP